MCHAIKNNLIRMGKKSVVSSILLLCAFYFIHPISRVNAATIDIGSYSLEQPSGDDWQVEVNKEKAIVTFTKKDEGYFGGLLNMTKSINNGEAKPSISRRTIIKVSRHDLDQQKWNMSEEEAASDFFNINEKIMIEEIVKGPSVGYEGDVYQVEDNYKLEDEKKGKIIIEGKNLYSLSYKTKSGVFNGGMSPKGPNRNEEARLYLYFPEDFKERHVFYSFRFSVMYMRGSSSKLDVNQINTVIGSFKDTLIKEE